MKLKTASLPEVAFARNVEMAIFFKQKQLGTNFLARPVVKVYNVFNVIYHYFIYRYHYIILSYHYICITSKKYV